MTTATLDTSKSEIAIQLQKEFEDDMVDSYALYAENLLKIKSKQSELIPFVRNRIQKIVEEIEQDIKDRGLLVRILMLKGRQYGVSTDRLGKNYWRTSTNFQKTAMFVTHEPKATAHLFSIVKRMHDNIPFPEWKPKTKYSNASELVFDGVDSAIRVGTAGSDNVGSSQTINYLHLSELAKYPTHSVTNILTSILQCVPKTDPDSEVFIESTAFGVGGEFPDRFWAAKYVYTVYLEKGKPVWKRTINEKADPSNEYARIFVPWFCHEEYQMDPPEDFKRTDKEQALVRIHGINDCHLAWRRNTIANECGGDESVFEQEYATTAEGAFIGSGSPVFQPTLAVVERQKSCASPARFYECQLSNGLWLSSIPDNGKTDGLLQVYEEPKAGMSYVIGADVAEGLEKGDFSALHIVEQLSGKDVAVWHGHVDPDLFGLLLYHTGKRYNTAWVAPERNNHGNTTVTTLLNKSYPKIYVETIEEAPAKPRKRYGWYTGTNKTAQAGLINTMVAEFRENPGNFKDAATLGEMVTYKRNPDGSMEAEKGHYDDRVMSRAIAGHVRHRFPLPASKPAEDSARQGSQQSSKKAPPIGAYT